MKEFEVEEVDVDYTLLGYRVESLINATVPQCIIDWFHNNDCGCDKRREWLNDKHFQFRMWRLNRAESNYKKAKQKLDNLKTRWL